MAENENKVEPEVTIELDRKRVMRMDFNTIVRVSDALGINMMTDEVDMSKMSVSNLRQFLWAFLVDDDPELTPEDVGRIVHPGNVAMFMQAIPKLQAVAVGKAPRAVKPVPDEKTSTG